MPARMFIMKSGPSIQNDEIFEQVNRKLRYNRRLLIKALSGEFSHVEHTSTYSIVTQKLGYHKLCAKWISAHSKLTQNRNNSIRLSRSPKSNQFRLSQYRSRKRRAIAFGNEKDIIFFDFMERGSTITTDVYCGTLTKIENGVICHPA